MTRFTLCPTCGFPTRQLLVDDTGELFWQCMVDPKHRMMPTVRQRDAWRESRIR